MLTSRHRLAYPGLRAYRRDETDLFFGREGCVNEMVDRLAAGRFLAVLGASGSGKSSLVRTGLLDALELGFLAEAGPCWTIADCHPGSNPMRNLAAALLATKHPEPTGTDIDALETFLQRGPRSVVQWVNDGNLPAGQNLLLLVDQFEELFRYSDYNGREEAEAFVALLLESVASDVPINVVITMRSEYLGACALIPSLAERINSSMYLTRRMTWDECRQAIEGPARVLGFELEPRLVTRLLNDLTTLAPWEADREDSQLERLSRQADQLPLMQHVLNRLWLRATRDNAPGPIRLTLADYLDLGQLRGALEQHGAEILEGLGAGRARAAEVVFRGLVAGASVATAVRQPTRLAELIALADGDAEGVRAVVEAFRAPTCNFLRPAAAEPLHDDSLVDISHESLIRQWSVLSEWLDVETRAGAMWRRLSGNTESYHRGEGGLLSGIDLEAAQNWWTKNHPNAAWADRHGGGYEAVTAFLAESGAKAKEHEEAERRAVAEAREREEAEKRRIRRGRKQAYIFGAAMTALMILASVLGVISVNNNRELAHTNRMMVEQEARLTSVNSGLEVYKKRAIALTLSFTSLSDDIRKANVIGFSAFQDRLATLIIPFQEYTLRDTAEQLTPLQKASIRFANGRLKENRGENEVSIQEIASAYGILHDYLSRNDRPKGSDADYVKKFLNIVEYHAWNLMNAGDYRAAWDVLEFSRPVEEGYEQGRPDAEMRFAIGGVENARGRFWSDAGDTAKEYAAQQRALTLVEQAIALAPDNEAYIRSRITYLTNIGISERNLAKSILTTDPERSARLESDAKSHDTSACSVAGEMISSKPLAVNWYDRHVLCARDRAQQLLRNSDFDGADKVVSEALALVEPALKSDPDLQTLALARLNLFDKSYQIENARSQALSASKKQRGERLLHAWIDIVENTTTLPIDIYILGNSYTTISGFLDMDQYENGERLGNYRRIWNALSKSRQAFPGAKKYQEIAANTAFRLSEIIQKDGSDDAQVLQFSNEAIGEFSKLGIFDKYEAANEQAGNACSSYGQQIRTYRRLGRVDAAIEAYRALMARCEPIVRAHPWDFYLRQHLFGGSHQLGEMLLELGRYDEARSPIEYASHWGDGDMTRYLSQMYRSGLGVERNSGKADELLALAPQQSMKRFTVPTDFEGIKYPFNVYVRQWPAEYGFPGIDDQVRWVREYRGGVIPTDVVESFHKLDKIAHDNNVSLPELAAYALGTIKNAALAEEIVRAKASTGFVANPAISLDAVGIAIRGYDPVSYLDGSSPTVGSQKYLVLRDGAIWLFSSAANRDKFLGDPARYLPAFGGYCSECLAQGHKLHADPTVWAIHDGRVYLHQSAALRDYWSKEPEQRIVLANAKWDELRQKAIGSAVQYWDFAELARQANAQALLRSGRATIKTEHLAEALTKLKNAEEQGANLDQDFKSELASAFGSLSYHAALTGSDQIAIEAADHGLGLDKTKEWIATNRAHALMFLGRETEARSVYMLKRGAKMPQDSVWEVEVQSDFAELRKAGRTNPLMNEIEAVYSGHPIQKP